MKALFVQFYILPRSVLETHLITGKQQLMSGGYKDPAHGTASYRSWALWGAHSWSTVAFHRTFRLCQPCQDLPKGVACQSAKCVRARQKPGRITSPAWPGAPSCPWTTAQLWTGNKKWEIQLQTYSSPQLDQRLCLFPTLNGLIDPK